MDFKYKIADVAKEFGMPAKKVVETVSGVTGEAYKTAGTFEEKELNVLLETLTRENAEDSLDAYLASGKEPAPAPKAEKKPEPKKQPAAAQKPAAKPKPAEQPKPAAKQEPKPEQKKDSRKPEKPAEKRSEKRVTLQELAADTGIKEPVKTEQVQVNRAQVSVDTRTVDVNVDKFNARYDDLADSRNMPSKRKNQPTGKKEKFNNRNNRRGQQFGRRRETEAERLQRTTEKLLDLSRRDDGVQPDVTIVDLQQAVHGTLHLLRPLADRSSVTITCLMSEGVTVRASEDDIYHIVFNLVENAIKYNLPGGDVTVRVETRGEQSILSVADTGIGIPEADRPNIFNRFYRVDKARSREHGGSGLGLSIVHDAAALYGGVVTVDGVEPHGTRFTVTFPRAAASGAPETQKEVPELSLIHISEPTRH